MHLFFTGKRNIGKSTLLRKLLENVDHIGGFVTLKTLNFYHDQATVHLLDLMNPKDSICEGNFLFACNEQKSSSGNEKFNVLGSQVLQKSIKSDVDLIVMDELGPYEEKAKKFQEKVISILDGEIPVLGVLQDSESVFLEKIKKHEKVKLVEVTKENRDKLMNMNLSQILKLNSTTFDS